jgi:hypothetical protein
MVAFHTVCNLSVIGKRFGGAGLCDLAVEAGIIADGSISKVLEGRHYNRGVRLRKLIYEGIIRLLWRGFFEWIESKPNLRSVLQEALSKMQKFVEGVDTQAFDDLLEHAPTVRILDLFDTYYE